jgi:two-component system, chemotaxis family, chemotaxis protein CheY
MVAGDIGAGAATMLERSALSAADQKDLAAAGTAKRVAPRLLVIDEDTLHRMIICRAAANAGYLPAGAATYDEAAKLLAGTMFDCVTLDPALGKDAGVKMLRHFWVIGCKAPIFIIGTCDDAAYSESKEVAEALKLNIRASIAKPVDISVLRGLLEGLKAERDGAPANGQQSAQVSPA